MNNFGAYLTPEEAAEKEVQEGQTSAKYYRKLAKKRGLCEVCETEEVWRLADTGMCFSCTTGEWDASDDYELTLE